MKQHLTRLPKHNKERVLNRKDSEGYTAVHYAAKFNRFKILQLLVTHGAGERGRGREGEYRPGGETVLTLFKFTAVIIWLPFLLSFFL